jgi:PPM family protein phosphatase
VIGERPFEKRSALLTEQGQRRVNQDAVLAVVLPDGSELLAVADGMGGQAAGEVASRLALAVLQAALHNGEGLEAAVHAANTAVFEEARSRPDCAGMGTTLVAMHRRGDSYMLANVGDSRAYRVDEHGVHQLTLDHSFLAEARRSGGVARREAERSPWRNAVTRAIGTDARVQVDSFGPYDSREPHSLLLCTDGLYRVLSDEQLQTRVRDAASPHDAVVNLARDADAAGSDDNISLVVGQFGIAPGSAHDPPVAVRRWSLHRPVQKRRKTPDWKSTADAVMFMVLLIVVIYLAVAGLRGR